jgi:hypothetical protein
MLFPGENMISILVLIVLAAVCGLYWFAFHCSTKGWLRFPFYYERLDLPVNVVDPGEREKLQQKWQIRHDHLIRYCQVGGAILFIATCTVLGLFRYKQGDSPKITTPQTLILLFWMAIMPAYMFVEYALFWDKIPPKNTEHLRHFQVLTLQLWIALIAIFASICIGTFFVPAG